MLQRVDGQRRDSNESSYHYDPMQIGDGFSSGFLHQHGPSFDPSSRTSIAYGNHALPLDTVRGVQEIDLEYQISGGMYR
ncbi:hypothetical protein QQ045_012717 [Rhodiola kirilowii]